MRRMNIIQCIYACIFILSCLHKGDSELVEDVSSNTQTILSNDEEGILENEFYNKELTDQKYLQIRCPKALPPENGIIKGEHINIGAELYVKCRDGYRLEGPAGMTCVSWKNGAIWKPDVRRVCVEIASWPQSPETEQLEIDHGTEPRSLKQKEVNSPPSFIPRDQPKPFKTPGQLEENIKEIARKKQISESSVKLPSLCLYTPEAGPCGAFYNRYYFNKAAMECHKFVYGGCEGNGNNFETLTDCNLACLGHD